MEAESTLLPNFQNCTEITFNPFDRARLWQPFVALAQPRSEQLDLNLHQGTPHGLNLMSNGEVVVPAVDHPGGCLQVTADAPQAPAQINTYFVRHRRTRYSGRRRARRAAATTIDRPVDRPSRADA